MRIIKNHILQGKHYKPILVDAFYQENSQQKPIVIFCHGYKGFKDWGAWNSLAEAFAKAGFFFIKFNFSYNGGTIEQPIDFPDLDAFGNNNYTKELDDVATVIDWIYKNANFASEINTKNISLIGHSRAGGIVTIKAEEEPRIKKVITLAGVSDFKKRTATTGDVKQWKKDEVKYVTNERTKQQMPHFYQFYEDFIQNEDRLTIKRAVKSLTIPHLIIHGDKDTSILINEAEIQHTWNPKSQLEIIKNADHVFGAKHPWENETLPKKLAKTIQICLHFLQN